MSNIKFCSKCGKILHAQIQDNGLIGLCGCGFSIALDNPISMSDKEQKENVIGEGVANEDKSLRGFPNTCKKCGHEGCDVYDLGAPYSDESNIYLYKCKKCGFVERRADGTGNN